MAKCMFHAFLVHHRRNHSRFSWPLAKLVWGGADISKVNFLLLQQYKLFQLCAYLGSYNFFTGFWTSYKHTFM
jgi:hypothetical protein